MFQNLVNHNDDMWRLVEKGYAVAFDSNCLVVRDIPYLDSDRKLQVGAIVTKLVFIDQERVTQEDHQIFFAGSIPHGLDQGQLPLKHYADKDFGQEVVAPTACATLHRDAVLARMLF